MPNILLFGCDKELVNRLYGDSRWNVAIGAHDIASSPDVPDPRHWHLIVDDCLKEDNKHLEDDELPDVPRYWISDDYLNEAGRAHGIRLCGEKDHLSIWADFPAGHKMLEFNPTGHSNAPEHLIDFIDEFEEKFTTTSLKHKTSAGPRRECRPIFRDGYGDPLLEFHPVFELTFLCSIDMVEKATRIEALLYLCQRTVPRLWPQVYGDLFRPRKVVVLEERRAEIIAKRRQEVADIEQEIQNELDFYAPYANLPWSSHSELKRLVAKAFGDVFGFAVEDLDASLDKGEPKTLDILIEGEGWSAMMEVRSGSNRNARVDDLEKLDDNYERAKKTHGPTDSRILVFNGLYGRNAEERKQNPTFSKLVADEAEARGVGLLTAEELLRAIEAQRSNEMTVQQFVGALKRPGLFLPPWAG